MYSSGFKLLLGPKVMQNDWAALLDRYWLLLLFVLVLLAWIIVIPFVGICYCCLCCCLRCKQGLFLMILGLIFGLAIAFVANRFVDRGLRDIKQTLQRSTDDTCAFLKNVAEHIHHLMVYNHQELESYLDVHINDVPNHIFLDLMDVSEGNSLAEQERILDNMPKVYQLMKQVDVLEKEMRFLGSQLKDASLRALQTIRTLLDAVERSEKFIQILGTNFINVLAKNLTAVINERIKDYVERVIWESMTNVGRCHPLAYIYYQGVHSVCARLVDPINAFWLATIICALLLLPTLVVCHRLMCLYLRIYPAPVDDAAGVVVGGCPFCTGLPAPVAICQSSQQAYCECPLGARTDQAEASDPVQTEPQVQGANKNPVTERSKRKND